MDGFPWYQRETSPRERLLDFYHQQHRSRLETHLLPQFGNHRFEELDPMALEEWLYALDYSGQWGKHICHTLSILLNDMKRDKLISFVASDTVPPIMGHAEKQVPTDVEASRLFPESIARYPASGRRNIRMQGAHTTPSTQSVDN